MPQNINSGCHLGVALWWIFLYFSLVCVFHVFMLNMHYCYSRGIPHVTNISKVEVLSSLYRSGIGWFSVQLAQDS